MTPSSVDLRPNKFTWLGSTRSLDAFKYFFRETPQGIVLAHCYQYEPGRSTWVIEMNADTWENFGFGAMDEPSMLRTIEAVFAEELEALPAAIAQIAAWLRRGAPRPGTGMAAGTSTPPGRI